VQNSSERIEARFGHRFRESRVRVNREIDFLDSELVLSRNRDLEQQLSGVRPDDVGAEDLAVHAHPTLAEAVAEAALDSMGKMIHA
jgi:dihydrolipoamide dehydrogenase